MSVGAPRWSASESVIDKRELVTSLKFVDLQLCKQHHPRHASSTRLVAQGQSWSLDRSKNMEAPVADTGSLTDHVEQAVEMVPADRIDSTFKSDSIGRLSSVPSWYMANHTRSHK